MQWGQLSQYVRGVGAKRLSAVEIDPKTSHQHEFQGIQAFRTAFGTERLEVPATVLWLPDEEDEIQQISGILKWYDARENQPHRSPEYRLYYPAEAESVIHNATPGDLLVLGLTTENQAIITLAPAGSTTERQLLWLFGLPQELDQATAKPGEELASVELSVVESSILEAIGIKAQFPEAATLTALIERFGLSFPTTREMSEFARSAVEVDAIAEPDAALMTWYSTEEQLFKGLEKLVVQERLDQGFASVDEFLSESLKVHQRRKSRAGFALENQMEAILIANSISYSRGKITERKSKPDFIFPGIAEYHDSSFPTAKLTMLGSKSTCKERWRQILPEADRITEKHLLTLEPAISPAQTTEISVNHVHLVLPAEIHETYLESQRGDLLTVAEFLSIVRSRA